MYDSSTPILEDKNRAYYLHAARREVRDGTSTHRSRASSLLSRWISLSGGEARGARYARRAGAGGGAGDGEPRSARDGSQRDGVDDDGAARCAENVELRK